MKIYKHYLTKNRCYKRYAKMRMKGIVVHSTGCNNRNVTRYVDMKELGTVSSNHWNKSDSSLSKCVNGIIGYSQTLKKAVAVQTLPNDCKPWGCGSGRRGSYNNDHFQFEICEENCTDEKYFKQAWTLAVQWCAKLCKEYDIPVNKIVSHAEAHDAGYASNHGDADSYFAHFGKTMKDFRTDVQKELKDVSTSKEEGNGAKVQADTLRAKIICSELNVRAGAGTSYKVNCTVKKGEVFTIVQTAASGKWGKLKSGAGWISLNKKYVTILG